MIESNKDLAVFIFKRTINIFQNQETSNLPTLFGMTNKIKHLPHVNKIKVICKSYIFELLVVLEIVPICKGQQFNNPH